MANGPTWTKLDYWSSDQYRQLRKLRTDDFLSKTVSPVATSLNAYPYDPQFFLSEINTSFTRTGAGAIRFGFQIDVDPAEVSTWSPERIGAFFAGIAQVLRAKGGMELKEGSGG